MSDGLLIYDRLDSRQSSAYLAAEKNKTEAAPAKLDNSPVDLQLRFNFTIYIEKADISAPERTEPFAEAPGTFIVWAPLMDSDAYARNILSLNRFLTSGIRRFRDDAFSRLVNCLLPFGASFVIHESGHEIAAVTEGMEPDSYEFGWVGTREGRRSENYVLANMFRRTAGLDITTHAKHLSMMQRVRNGTNPGDNIFAAITGFDLALQMTVEEINQGELTDQVVYADYIHQLYPSFRMSKNELMVGAVINALADPVSIISGVRTVQTIMGSDDQGDLPFWQPFGKKLGFFPGLTFNLTQLGPRYKLGLYSRLKQKRGNAAAYTYVSFAHHSNESLWQNNFWGAGFWGGGVEAERLHLGNHPYYLDLGVAISQKQDLPNRVQDNSLSSNGPIMHGPTEKIGYLKANAALGYDLPRNFSLQYGFAYQDGIFPLTALGRSWKTELGLNYLF